MSSSKPEILISFDGEFTGPIPGLHSMISFGAVAYASDGTEIGHFRRNMRELPGSERWPETMAWWDTKPEAWEASTRHASSPSAAMVAFDEWLTGLPGQPILMGWPLPCDWMFITWYYVKFLMKEPPFGHSGLDVKSFAMACLKTETFAGEKDGISMKTVATLLNLPSGELSHDPLDDARHQAMLYFGLRRMLMAGKFDSGYFSLTKGLKDFRGIS